MGGQHQIGNEDLHERHGPSYKWGSVVTYSGCDSGQTLMGSRLAKMPKWASINIATRRDGLSPD